MGELKDKVGDGAESGLLEEFFDGMERAYLRGALERREFDTIRTRCVLKGLTAEGDRRQVLEELAGGRIEATDEDMRATILDLDSGSEGGVGADLPLSDGADSAQSVTSRYSRVEADSIMDRVMRRATGEIGEAQLPRGWRLNMAMLFVVISLKESGQKVTREQFRNLVISVYRGLERLV